MGISQLNLEKINRFNFRVCMETLARPGTAGKIDPLFGSTLNAMACCLLYSEVSSYFTDNDEEQQLRAVTGSPAAAVAEADYLFCPCPDADIVRRVKSGSLVSPELSATMFFQADCHKKTKVILAGPGIKTTLSVTLPVGVEFIQAIIEKNKMFPLGVDCFFLDSEDYISAISRTTLIEVSG